MPKLGGENMCVCLCVSDSLCTHFSVSLNCVVVPLASAHAKGWAGGAHQYGWEVVALHNARECVFGVALGACQCGLYPLR